MKRYAILPLLLALSGCTPDANESAGGEQAARVAETEVNGRIMKYPAAVMAGQLDSALAFWAPDVRIFVNGLRIERAAQQRELGTDFLAKNQITRLAFAPNETVAHDDGAVVYQFGYYTEDVKAKSSSDTTTNNVRANYASRWIKDAQGNWRIHRWIAAPASKDPAPAPTVQPITPGTAGTAGTASVIEQRMQDYAGVLLSNDVNQIAAFWADDVRVLEPELEVNDKPALVKLANEILGQLKIVRVEVTSEEVFVHDNGIVAYQLGHYIEQLEPKTAGH